MVYDTVGESRQCSLLSAAVHSKASSITSDSHGSIQRLRLPSSPLAQPLLRTNITSVTMPSYEHLVSKLLEDFDAYLSAEQATNNGEVALNAPKKADIIAQWTELTAQFGTLNGMKWSRPFAVEIKNSFDQAQKDAAYIDSLMVLLYRKERMAIPLDQSKALQSVANTMRCSVWHLFLFFKPEIFEHRLSHDVKEYNSQHPAQDTSVLILAAYICCATRLERSVSDVHREDIEARDVRSSLSEDSQRLAMDLLASPTQGRVEEPSERGEASEATDLKEGSTEMIETIIAGEHNAASDAEDHENGNDDNNPVATPATEADGEASPGPENEGNEQRESATDTYDTFFQRHANTNSLATGDLGKLEDTSEMNLDGFEANVDRIENELTQLHNVPKLCRLRNSFKDEEKKFKQELQNKKRDRDTLWADFLSWANSVDPSGVSDDVLGGKTAQYKQATEQKERAKEMLEEARRKRRRVDALIQPHEDYLEHLASEIRQLQEVIRPPRV
ncbi:hypothetical protein GGR57DRAFT_508818 [Xylariaceae sp. FL1272]|nr:hypothetical protein GGR57DRAFT_508818 [Xylariaceae sp. FL1272]